MSLSFPLKTDECDFIRFQGGSLHEEDPEFGLGIFQRVIVEHEYLNDTVEYHAVDGSDYAVWMMQEWQLWVVGKDNIYSI